MWALTQRRALKISLCRVVSGRFGVRSCLALDLPKFLTSTAVNFLLENNINIHKLLMMSGLFVAMFLRGLTTFQLLNQSHSLCKSATLCCWWCWQSSCNNLQQSSLIFVTGIGTVDMRYWEMRIIRKINRNRTQIYKSIHVFFKDVWFCFDAGIQKKSCFCCLASQLKS